jgi:lipid A 3-O-deacylase
LRSPNRSKEAWVLPVYLRSVVQVVAAIALLSLAPLHVGAAEKENTQRPERFVTLTGDNDFFAGYDHHYTNGFQFAVSADGMSLPKFMRSLPPLRNGNDPQINFAFGQRIYTPTDTNRANPDPLDRPYGGWLYALMDIRVRSGNAVDSMQASLGVIGPASLAEQTQNIYHGLIGAEKSQGWDAQIGNQLAVLLGYERAWPSVLQTPVGPLTADITPKVGVTVGNVYTYANTGAVFRIGQNLPDDFPVTDISLGPPRDGYRPSGDGFGWYAWMGIDARAVAWNTFLDGSMFGDGPSVKRKPFGHDLQLGLVTVWNKSRVGFTFVRRSKEFETQTGADKFGQITFSFAL